MVNAKDDVKSDKLSNISDTLVAMTVLGNEFHMDSEQRRHRLARRWSIVLH